MQNQPKTSDVTFYFNFQCVYCYLAWVQLKKYLNNINASINFCEVSLSFEEQTEDTHPFDFNEKLWDILSDDAKSLGVLLNKPQKYVFPDLLNLDFASLKNETFDYLDALFEAFFVDSIDFSSFSDLNAYLTKKGLKPILKDNPQLGMESVKHNLAIWEQNSLRLLPTIEYGEARYAGFFAEKGLSRFLQTYLK